jgi:hypothetical protein
MKHLDVFLLCCIFSISITAQSNQRPQLEFGGLSNTDVSGTVTVGSGGTYPTLTGAGGLFEAINLAGMEGNTIVQVISDITEPGTIALNQWTESGGSNYTLTIQPDAATARTLSGSYAGGLIRLNGADRVTIDGRYGGSGKYLTITNTASSGTISSIQIISLGTGLGATNNTVRDCNISTGHHGTTSYAIAAGGVVTGTPGDDNDYLTIQSCNISKAHYGIYAGANSTGVNNNLLVAGNVIGSTIAADYIQRFGIYIAQATGAAVSDNTVYNIISSTLATPPTGMCIAAGVVNTTITRNNIHAVKYTGSSNIGAIGLLALPGSSASGLTIANNLLYDITGNGANSPGNTSIAGIVLNGSSGGVDIYYNSVYLFGNISRSGATSDKSMALYITTGTSNLNIKNNILVNSIENTTGVSWAYAIYSAVSNAAYNSINNNDYFAAGPEAMLGYLGTNKATIALWRAATGQDAQSLGSDPLYASSTNLHCDFSSPVFLAGSPVAGITTDYENAARNGTNPTIGAYENGTDAIGPTYSYAPLGNTTSTADRTLAVTLNDYTGFPLRAPGCRFSTGGSMPVPGYRLSQSTSARVSTSSPSVPERWSMTLSIIILSRRILSCLPM